MSREEAVNSITHGSGILLSAAGGAFLIVLAASTGDPWKVVGASIFAASLLLLYSASTAYHAARSLRGKKRLAVLDHASIYVLIAGTYTPFMLDAMRGPWGWSLFGVIWGLAVTGVCFKLFYTVQFSRLSTAIYVAMGWLVLIAAGPLARRLDTTSLVWLVAGGVIYTAGTAFYHSRRRYSHAVWHVFVIGGSLCHAVAIGLQM